VTEWGREKERECVCVCERERGGREGGREGESKKRRCDDDGDDDDDDDDDDDNDNAGEHAAAGDTDWPQSWVPPPSPKNRYGPFSYLLSLLLLCVRRIKQNRERCVINC